jgi:predicted deacetylase
VKSLVVSLHDVSPVTQNLCDKILVELWALGIRQVSLLVIPNHHGRAPISESLEFQRWLTRAIGAGHEPVLHGYYHRRKRGKADSFLRRITTEFYTAGEGEFYDLSRGEAAMLLERGLADLSFLPRKISGFVAPAWLLGAEAESAVRELGFLYTTRLSKVRVLGGNVEIASQSLVWSTRAGWRASMSLIWNRSLIFCLGEAPLVRISIHPPDAQHGTVWKQIRKMVMATSRTRQCVSYEKFVENLAR